VKTTGKRTPPRAGEKPEPNSETNSLESGSTSEKIETHTQTIREGGKKNQNPRGVQTTTKKKKQQHFSTAVPPINPDEKQKNKKREEGGKKVEIAQV